MIAVVEDEKELCESLKMLLTEKGYEIVTARSCDEADKYIGNPQIDMFLLDVKLPDGNGFDICRKIRKSSEVPVIFLTSCDNEEEIVTGLDIGADDYITKPFSVEEFLARLRVTIRRINYVQTPHKENSIFVNGELKIDYVSGCAYCRGKELHLTPIEYKLLCLLAKNIGKVLTHTYITREVWGNAWDNNVASLRVFMATLRKKIEIDTANPEYIQTHIGIGYRMLKLD